MKPPTMPPAAPETGGLGARKLVRCLFFPVISLACAGGGWLAWDAVPTASDCAALEMRKSAAMVEIDRRQTEDAKVEVEDDIERRLPSTLEFADFLERIEASAARAGIVGLHVDSAESIDRVPAPGLRSYGGTLHFDSSWKQVVAFLAEIENGAPAMRVRSLMAESGDSTIHVECVIDAWAYAAAPEGKE